MQGAKIANFLLAIVGNNKDILSPETIYCPRRQYCVAGELILVSKRKIYVSENSQKPIWAHWDNVKYCNQK